MFEKILIANRGEVALRILRACQGLGIATVAAHSTADSDAMHVRLADESVCIGPATATASYLNIPALVSAAEITGADAVHPGYGFLSENARFATILEAHDIAFIGPSAEHIRLMGDKIAARSAMKAAGLPVLPGTAEPMTDDRQAAEAAAEIGYPVLIKAAAGGGGRGIKIVREEKGLAPALAAARAEAMASFNDSSVYLEKFLTGPRHIEIQILADGQGEVLHLGERECSLQRRYQKLLEEAPSPALRPGARDRIADAVVEAIKAIGYKGLGTAEFLYEDGAFHFIEMNTRLQVEHPITEAVTGIDLVQEQIRVAAGERLRYRQSDIIFRGHAIECRVNAENAMTFQPSPGLVEHYHPPGGFGVRVDSGLYAGYRIPPFYDSLVAKLIVHGATREECRMRLRQALGEFVIGGIDTTIPLHQKLIDDPDFISGAYNIRWLEEFIAKQH